VSPKRDWPLPRNRRRVDRPEPGIHPASPSPFSLAASGSTRHHHLRPHWPNPGVCPVRPAVDGLNGLKLDRASVGLCSFPPLKHEAPRPPKLVSFSQTESEKNDDLQPSETPSKVALPHLLTQVLVQNPFPCFARSSLLSFAVSFSTASLASRSRRLVLQR
jgi:hypothetical protein